MIGVASVLKPSPLPLSQWERGIPSPVTSNCFHRTAGHRFFTHRSFGFVLRLFADVGIGMFERAGEIFRSSIAADVAIDARAVNVENAGDVLFDFVVWIGHESADYADFTDYTNSGSVLIRFRALFPFGPGTIHEIPPITRRKPGSASCVFVYRFTWQANLSSGDHANSAKKIEGTVTGARLYWLG